MRSGPARPTSSSRHSATTWRTRSKTPSGRALSARSAASSPSSFRSRPDRLPAVLTILSLAPLAGPGVDLLRALGDLKIDPWNAHVPIQLHSAEQLVERLAGVDALIVEADHISAEVLEKTELKYLGVCRGDPNNVDVPAATKKGVLVIRTPGRNANAVAELTIGLMFTLLRWIVEADDDIRAGRWVIDGRIAQQRYQGREMTSLEVGLVGAGAVGRAVAERLRALGAANVMAYDPVVDPEALIASGIEPVPVLGDLIARADIISVHAPLTPATRGLLGEKEFARVKPGAFFVNTARFGIAAEEPLLAALRDGRLAAAAFDHFENEFLSPEHPLASMPNVVLTPHIGGSTIETIENHTLTIAQGIHDVLEGKIPGSVVNPEVL
ncbi:MAG: 3-phosphoglycerate dehydrogenase [Actinobacteria bacterium]|nr:MAG: 3-phosphoglycerate dehydrogenase [Actinomycetota bacterium]